MSEERKSLHRAGVVLAYVWLFGGLAYYLVRFSKSFYTENEAQIRRALESLFGG